MHAKPYAHTVAINHTNLHLVPVLRAHDLERHTRARREGRHKRLTPLHTAWLDGITGQQERVALCVRVCV